MVEHAAQVELVAHPLAHVAGLMLRLGGRPVLGSPLLPVAFVEEVGVGGTGAKVVDAVGVGVIKFGELLGEDVSGEAVELEGHGGDAFEVSAAG